MSRYEQAQLSDHHNTGVSQIALEKRVISFLADRRIPVVLFKSRRSSEKCIKKRRNPLYRKDFRVISFLAARYKNSRASVREFYLSPPFFSLTAGGLAK